MPRRRELAGQTCEVCEEIRERNGGKGPKAQPAAQEALLQVTTRDGEERRFGRGGPRRIFVCSHHGDVLVRLGMLYLRDALTDLCVKAEAVGEETE